MTTKVLTPSLKVLLAATSAAGLLGTTLLTSSENLLRSSFAHALNDQHTPALQTASTAPVSGSEEYWLSAIRQDVKSPLTKTVAVGDQIALSLGGDRRTLEVASVAEFAPQITAIDTSAGPSRFVLVTARDTKNSAARPIRFVMEVDTPSAAIVAEGGGRAL